MKTRMKTVGAAAAFAAIALSIPTAVSAYADEPTPAPPAPTTTISTPVARIPDPQGPGCDAYKTAVATGAGSFASLAKENASAAIAANPDLSDFNAAISGQWNPAVNLVQRARQRPVHRVRARPTRRSPSSTRPNSRR